MKYLFKNYMLIFFMIIVSSCNKVTPNKQAKSDFNSKVTVKKGVLLEISAEELLKLLKYDKNAFVIDVRKADKSIRSCKLISGYKHLEDSLIYKNPNLLPKEKTIVLLSKDGIRSRKLGEFLSKKGMTVYNVKGGMDSYWEWRESIIREKLNIYDDEIDVLDIYAEDFGC